MKQLLTIILLILIAVSCDQKQAPNDSNTEEWVALFNGVNLDGWEVKITGRELNDNYLETFAVEDSMIRIQYKNYDEFGTYFGHMYYETPFSYYRIKFDYRFVGDQLKGGAEWNVRNSGIMFHSQSAASNEFDQHFPVSVELQLLGGLNEGERTTANVCTPGTAVVMGDTVNYDHCINSTSETYHGDQWVSAEAIVLGGESMTFLVEGDTVLSFDKPQTTPYFINGQDESQDWEAFGISRDKDMWKEKGGTILTEGYIALQAESHPIDFKNIKLLDLCGCMDPKAKNYKSYYMKDKPEACVY